LKKDRTHALNWLGHDQVSDYLKELKASRNPELGYYCEAQLVACHAAGSDGLDHAIDILEHSAEVTPLSERSLRLLISLLRRHPIRQMEFQRLLQIYEELEQAVGATMQPVEQFRHAVLYFQVSRFREGEIR